MTNLRFVETPVFVDGNKPAHTMWVDDKCKMLNHGSTATVFIGHKTETKVDEEGNESTVTVAFPITIDFPITRAKLINQAEMDAYSLKDAMEVASFTASLARKSRENSENVEVREHDDFISWVKNELTSLRIK